MDKWREGQATKQRKLLQALVAEAADNVTLRPAMPATGSRPSLRIHARFTELPPGHSGPANAQLELQLFTWLEEKGGHRSLTTAWDHWAPPPASSRAHAAVIAPAHTLSLFFEVRA